MLALHSWIVKIPPHGNDFLSVAKLTYCEREREKKRQGGKEGKKEDKGTEIYKNQRECVRVSRKEYRTIVLILFPTCRSALHRVHFIRVFTKQAVIMANPSRPRYFKEINFTSLPR